MEEPVDPKHLKPAIIHKEQPIFTTKAHVFQIDPSTKKKWLPASTQAINVSYYFDSTRNSYRIISVEGSKAVINSTILPTMQFTKTSQKFGQWTDPRANTVYGLGFASEVELAKFIDKFKEVKELTRQASQKTATTNGTNESNHAPASPDTTTSNSPINKPPPISSSPVADAVINERRNSGSTPITTSSPGNAESHLKYENDRLKIALAQSSANAKKWEIELQTLKNNNARLTTALQESTANVEEWKKQLAMYKEESARMKKRVIEMEKGGGGDSALAQAQVVELNTKISQMEIGAQSKDNDLAELKRQVEQLRPLEGHNKQLTDRAQHFENENKRLQGQVTDLQSQGEQSRQGQQREKQQIRGLHDQLRNKISELYTLQDQVTSLLAS